MRSRKQRREKIITDRESGDERIEKRERKETEKKTVKKRIYDVVKAREQRRKINESKIIGEKKTKNAERGSKINDERRQT